MKKKNKLISIGKFLLPAVITVVILLVTFAIDGIIPFGDNNLIINDMGPGEVPNLVYLSNVLHGKTSFFYNWLIEGGYGSNPILSFLDPTTLIVALFPAEQIPDMVSLWVILKFVLVAVCAYPFFKKVFHKSPYYFHVILTLLYTFSSYTVRYFCNPSFMNYAALFPLLILALFALFQKGKYAPYVIILSYVLISSVYFGFFYVLFLLLFAPLYIAAFYPKKEWGNKAFRLGVATLASFVSSALSFIPSLIGITQGARFNVMGPGTAETAADTTATTSATGVSSSLIEQFKSIYLSKNTTDFNKIFMLMSIEVCVVFLILLLFKIKKDKKRILFFVGADLLLMLPIVFENINLIWHGGSYNGYSMRNGFMLIFMLICTGAYYLQNFDAKRNSEEKNRIFVYIKIAVTFLMGVITMGIYQTHADNLQDFGVLDYGDNLAGSSLIRTYSWSLLCFALLYLFIQLFKNKKARNAITGLAVCIFFCYNIIWQFGVFATTNQSGYYKELTSTTALGEEIQEPNALIRTADKNGAFLVNSALLLNRSAVGGWNHGVSAEKKGSFAKLGYTVEYSVVCDAGSTPFVDSLLGVRDYLSNLPMNTALFNEVKGVGDGDIKLYQLKNALPFGAVFSKDLSDIDFGEDILTYQNNIAAALLGSNDTALFTPAAFTEKTYKTVIEQDANALFNASGFDGKLNADAVCKEYTFNLNSDEVLYVIYNDVDGITNDTVAYNQFQFDVNGVPLTVPLVKDQSNTYYPAAFSNGPVALTSGESGKVTVTATSTEKEPTFTNLRFYTFNLTAWQALCEDAYSPVTDYSTDGANITVSLNSEKAGYIFIPVAFYDEWQCTVNGEKAEIINALGNFCAIKIDKGKSEIQMKYDYSDSILFYAKLAACALAAAVAILIVKKTKLDNNKFFTKVSAVLLLFTFVVGFAVTYLCPLIFQIVRLIS